MVTRNELGSQMLRTLFEVLEKTPEGLHKSQVWNRVLGRNPALEERWSQTGEGKSSAFTRFTWDSVGAVKAGWLRKDGNVRWQLTGAGHHTLGRLPENEDIGVLINARQQQWAQNKTGYELACSTPAPARGMVGRTRGPRRADRSGQHCSDALSVRRTTGRMAPRPG